MLPKPFKPGAPIRLILHKHQFVELKDGYMRCVKCGKGAKEAKVRQNLQATAGTPTELGRFKCQAQLDWVGRSMVPTLQHEAVTQAILGADRVLGALPDQFEAHQEERSTHKLFNAGPYTGCRVCGFYGEAASGSVGLGQVCPGPKRVSTATAYGKQNKRKLDRLLDGRHPLTGIVLKPVVAVSAQRE